MQLPIASTLRSGQSPSFSDRFTTTRTSSSTLTILFSLDRSFSLCLLCLWTPWTADDRRNIRVIRTRTNNRVIPSDDHRAVRTRKRIARCMRADRLRRALSNSSWEYRFCGRLWRIWRTSTRIVLSESVQLTSVYLLYIVRVRRKCSCRLRGTNSQLSENAGNFALITHIYADYHSRVEFDKKILI